MKTVGSARFGLRITPATAVRVLDPELWGELFFCTGQVRRIFLRAMPVDKVAPWHGWQALETIVLIASLAPDFRPFSP
ncbi:hypothetical protein [Devosia sp. FKR38]|uniref:hypothetical protein n=1 Tax=Devosia sp. FKR38 TaxID=2562312 RepID=UPI0010C03103|nr:hypothetical protein [Devosia sp. FKR38]